MQQSCSNLFFRGLIPKFDFQSTSEDHFNAYYKLLKIIMIMSSTEYEI